MEDSPRVPIIADRTTQERIVAVKRTRNPFDIELDRTSAVAVVRQDDAPSHMLEPQSAALAEFVHDSFRALVLNPKFSCVAAKSAIQRDRYRLGVYRDLGSIEATAGLARDLYAFVQAQNGMGDGFSTFVASFTRPTITNELHFEQLLWDQLQCLHNHDTHHYDWDPTVSSDPEHPEFGFSFAGRAFFIVGLHPATSRWTRRFAWPTLVFNAHFQFEALKAQGKFTRMQEVIRSRERALQGSVNAMLSDFGERSEARQYSGRAIGPEWQCPFHAQSKSEAAE